MFKQNEAEYFSPNETKILKALGRKKMTIGELTENVYNTKDKPFGANNIVANAVIRITKKCRYHHLDWTLDSEGGGRAGKTVWQSNK